jgi:acetate kinase
LQGKTIQPAATVTRNQPIAPEIPGGTPGILTINGGSSSIKFALFSAADPPRQLLSGIVERIGQPNTVLRAQRDGATSEEKLDGAAGHGQAAEYLITWLRQQMKAVTPIGIGHRVVHGGVHAVEHQVVTEELLAELRRTQPLDLAHLPREIGLIEAFRRRYPSVPQVACFDTAFHRDLPRVAQLLPIPRHYYEAGVRRFGFHGLSYTYLMSELERIAGAPAAEGRVILAHLGAGASMAAVHRRKPVDTTMAFTPTAGLVMATRPGDLDPGLLVYMMRVQGMSPEQADEFISRRCGLIGLSQTTPDMQTLLRLRESDPRAADAVALFCYQAKKWIGAYAAALGGLDTLVFAGGIGEHAPQVRAEICQGLEYMGVRLDPVLNDRGAAVISPQGAAVTVRVMHTDEELMIARAVCRVLKNPACSDTSSTSPGARNGGA